jgi:hypothetical protein
MCCASVCHNRVDRVERTASPVCMDHADLRPTGERRLRLLASVGSISTAVTRPVSGAAAEMEYLFSRHEVEMVEQIGPRARLSVIDSARPVERD